MYLLHKTAHVVDGALRFNFLVNVTTAILSGIFRKGLLFNSETVITLMAVFWVVAACSLVEVYRRFRGPCCLHHHNPEDSHLRTHRRENLKSYLLSRLVFKIHKHKYKSKYSQHVLSRYRWPSGLRFTWSCAAHTQRSRVRILRRSKLFLRTLLIDTYNLCPSLKEGCVSHRRIWGLHGGVN
jgi:hypothetical protein